MKMKFYLPFLLVLFLAISCKEQEVISNENTTAPDDVIEFLTSSGFDANQIFFNGKEFTIGGDMIMSLESARRWMNSTPQTSDGRVKQRGHDIVINPTRARTIRYAFQHPFSISGDHQWWLAATRAIQTFIDLPGTSIKLIEVSQSENPDIVLRFNDNLPSSPTGTVLARAELPLSPVTPGRFVEIDRDNLNEQAYIAQGNDIIDVRQYIIAHEIGHTLGLRHSDLPEGGVIDCTPNGNDASSVLKAVVPSSITNPNYSAGDVLACQIMWPGVNKIITSPTGYIEFGETLNVYWNAAAITAPEVRIKLWQLNLVRPILDVVIANDGHHAFSATSMFSALAYENVTQRDRDTEAEFHCLRISIEAPTPYYRSVFDFTRVFTAHYSEYL